MSFKFFHVFKKCNNKNFRADYVGAWQEKKEDEGQSTLTTSRKLSIMRAIKSKSTTISPFLAASRSGSSLSGGSSRSSLRSPSPH